MVIFLVSNKYIDDAKNLTQKKWKLEEICTRCPRNIAVRKKSDTNYFQIYLCIVYYILQVPD